MASKHYLYQCVFWIIIWIVCFKVIHCGNTNMAASKSLFTKKYKINLKSIDSRCREARKWDKTKPVIHYVTAKKINRTTTIINANFTITRKVGPVMFAIRIYQVKTSQVKDLVWKSEKIQCKNNVIKQMLKILNLKMDKDCKAVPGFYEANPINLWDFYFVLTYASSGPGRYSYDLEFSTPAGVVTCVAIGYDLIEIK